MTTSSTNIDYTGPSAQSVKNRNWFQRTEVWLDAGGTGAWTAAMVLGFIFIWPVGLALLIYMTTHKRMFSGSCTTKRTRDNALRNAMRPSGNTAFDAYKADTLSRLEDEQHKFEEFLKRLRAAKDKAEFDQFMEDRASRTSNDDENDRSS